jgi:hypothetical protein
MQTYYELVAAAIVTLVIILFNGALSTLNVKAIQS